MVLEKKEHFAVALLPQVITSTPEQAAAGREVYLYAAGKNRVLVWHGWGGAGNKKKEPGCSAPPVLCWPPLHMEQPLVRLGVQLQRAVFASSMIIV